MKSDYFPEDYTLDFSRTENFPDSEGDEETPQNGPVVPPAPALEVPDYARSERRAEEIVFPDAFTNDLHAHGPDETEVASGELAQLASQLQINAEAEEEDDAVTDENRRFEDAEEDDTSSGTQRTRSLSTRY
ncbi:hypothetical protein FGB62_143g04 [Gracilaria domingensis]|nr:hypothetical protein FGB62_143g04 [Gracilaria domingensis]